MAREAIQLYDQWTANKRVSYLGKSFFLRRDKYALDISIGPQNYRNDLGLYDAIDLTPVISDLPQFNLMVNKAPYKLYAGLNGARRFYPNRVASHRYLDFPAPKVAFGRSFMLEGTKLVSRNMDYNIEIEWQNNRVTFDTILHKAPAFDKIVFDVDRLGINDDTILAMLGTPKVYEKEQVFGEAQSRMLDVSVKRGEITLGFDLMGMKFPLVIDPTLDLQVGAGADDVETLNDSDLFINGTIILAGKDSSNSFDSAFRFTGVTIPQGSIIDVAHLIITANANKSNTTVNTNVYGEDADDPGQITTISDYLGRARTSTVAAWADIEAWTTNTEYQSPELKTVVKTIVDRASYGEDAMIFFWEDNGSTASSEVRRTGYEYETDSSKAVKFHVEYTTGGAGGAAGLANRRRRRLSS